MPPGEPSKINCWDCLSYAMAGLTNCGSEPAGVTNGELAHAAAKGEAVGEPEAVPVGFEPPEVVVPHAAAKTRLATNQLRFRTWRRVTERKILGHGRPSFPAPGHLDR